MDALDQFYQLKQQHIEALGKDREALSLSREWLRRVTENRYSYHFAWMGVPIIQFPQDIVAMQEIIWRIKPDLIIETGIAHGGSIVFYASMLELIGGDSHIVGVDVDIRAHNRSILEQHPLRHRYTLIEGSSTTEATVEKVRQFAKSRKRILVCLDSNHTHDHVLNELRLYSPFVSQGSYLVVFDTIIEYFDASNSSSRPWHKGNNPLTAVAEFLLKDDRFQVDTEIDAKLLISAAPGGYLKRIK